jgi:hypothetical protein
MNTVGAIVGGIILVFIGLVIEYIFFNENTEVWNVFDEVSKYRFQSYLLIFSIGVTGLGIVFIIIGIVRGIIS